MTPKITVKELSEMRGGALPDRGISRQVSEFFRVKLLYDESGEVTAHAYPYDDGNAYKIRYLPKQFRWAGNSTGLFGKELFNSHGRRIIITEGEVDALSIAEAAFRKYGRIYPVVALSSATIAERTLLQEREWLRTFKEIIVCMDNDEAGHKAEAIAVKVLGIEKCRLMRLARKDPNEVLQQDGHERLMSAMFDAAPYVPKGLIDNDRLWQQLVELASKQATPFPPCLEGLNSKLKGMRGGEITLFTAGTGSGKSTIMREIVLHLLNTTDANLGLVFLEETPAESAKRLIAMKTQEPLETLTPENPKLKPEFDKLFSNGRTLMLDHQGSFNDGTILENVEYMCLMGCKFILIDHITILVSEGFQDLTGNEAQDKVMNVLLQCVKRYPDTWIGVVVHLRKTQPGKKSFEEGRLPSMDDIRGSGAIKQIAFDIVAAARNLAAEKEEERNHVKMAVLKARTTGNTGPVIGAIYDSTTGRLMAADSIPVEKELGIL